MTAKVTVQDLIDYGWLNRPSGRWVHPQLAAVPGSRRRRSFTEAEAMTITAAQMESRACADCGTVHDAGGAAVEA